MAETISRAKDVPALTSLRSFSHSHIHVRQSGGYPRERARADDLFLATLFFIEKSPNYLWVSRYEQKNRRRARELG
ncbi:uncharacterized protein BJX67DRAFT_353782 [Aspergillus lucknowensis]|uniref:Uncharacterized protein n=1 Tax=Aspergillus lucknowensis TaxID=176173 RepID=A0ABR4LRG5_9EURO